VPEKEEVDFVCLNFATTAIWWAIQELWVQQYKRVKLLINVEKVITTALAHNYTTPLQIMEIVKRWLTWWQNTATNPAHWLHPIDPWWCIRWYCSNYFRTRGWKPEVMTCHSLLWKVHHRVINYRTIKLFLIRNRQEWKSGENGSKGIGTENGKMERLVKMVTVKQMKIIKN
jgi:hypothetical protein